MRTPSTEIVEALQARRARAAVPAPTAVIPVLGVGIGIVYGLFALLAASRFPVPYGPWHDDTLSQLGNRHLNPTGYGFYLLGCAVSGLLAIGFFVALAGLRSGVSRWSGASLRLLQVLGIAGGMGLLMNGVFPETDHSIHHFWAGLVFNGLAAGMLIAPVAFWQPNNKGRLLLSFCLLGCSSVILMFLFASRHWLEWPPAVMLFLFPPLLGLLAQPRQRSVRHGGQ